MGATDGCLYMPNFCSDVGLDADGLWEAAKMADTTRDPAAKCRGKPLPRGKMYVNATGDDVVCVHKFPGFQYAAIEHYKQLQDVPWLEPVFFTLRNLHYEGAGLLNGATFNQAIVTLYESGTDNIGWHSDKLASIADPSVIFDISLGAERTFSIKSNETGKEESVCMRHGSAIAFTTAFNAEYKHAVLSEPGAKPRASVVFRHISDIYCNEQVAHKLKKRA